MPLKASIRGAGSKAIWLKLERGKQKLFAPLVEEDPTPNGISLENKRIHQTRFNSSYIVNDPGAGHHHVL
jgi:hypothetical protein